MRLLLTCPCCHSSALPCGCRSGTRSLSRLVLPCCCCALLWNEILALLSLSLSLSLTYRWLPLSRSRQTADRLRVSLSLLLTVVGSRLSVTKGALSLTLTTDCQLRVSHELLFRPPHRHPLTAGPATHLRQTAGCPCLITPFSFSRQAACCPSLAHDRLLDDLVPLTTDCWSPVSLAHS